MTGIVMLNLNYNTKVASFIVQSVSDLKYLPKCGVAGQDILNTVQSINFGSYALVADTSEVYILNKNNEWQVI